MSAPSPLFVSVPEAAVMLCLSEDSVLRLLDRKLLPEAPRWTRRRLVPRLAIEQMRDEAMAGFDPRAVLDALQQAAS